MLTIPNHTTETKFTRHFIVDILRPDRDVRCVKIDSSSPLSPSSSVSPLSMSPVDLERQQQHRQSKKMRTTFTGRQIFVMEKMFETKKYLNATERSHLSRCGKEFILWKLFDLFFQRTVCDRATSENLVPESEDEMEEAGEQWSGDLQEAAWFQQRHYWWFLW